MKSLITTNSGGFPMSQNRLEYLQTNVKSITSNIAKGLALGNNACILSGCVMTVTGSGGLTPVLNMTSGSIWYLDEVYEVDSMTANLPQGWTLDLVKSSYYWDLSEVVDYQVTYKDGLSKAIHKSRKAVFTTSPTTWVGLVNLSTLSDLLITPDATEIITGKVEIATQDEVNLGIGTNKVVCTDKLQVQEDWIDLPIYNTDGVDFSLLTDGFVKCRKNNLGYVEVALNGIHYEGTGGHYFLATLPVGYRPSRDLAYLALPEMALGGDLLWTIRIDTLGRIAVYSMNTTESPVDLILMSLYTFPLNV